MSCTGDPGGGQTPAGEGAAPWERARGHLRGRYYWYAWPRHRRPCMRRECHPASSGGEARVRSPRFCRNFAPTQYNRLPHIGTRRGDARWCTHMCSAHFARETQRECEVPVLVGIAAVPVPVQHRKGTDGTDSQRDIAGRRRSAGTGAVAGPRGCAVNNHGDTPKAHRSLK